MEGREREKEHDTGGPGNAGGAEPVPPVPAAPPAPGITKVVTAAAAREPLPPGVTGKPHAGESHAADSHAAESPIKEEPPGSNAPDALASPEPAMETAPVADHPNPAIASAAPPAKGVPAAGSARPLAPWEERPEEVVTIPRGRLTAPSRRDFLLFGAGTLAAAAGAWWLLPDRAKSRFLPTAHDRLDTLAARVGLTRERREATLNRALTFDDDIAEALYSKDRRVRTYSRRDITPLRNNYAGQTPGPETLASWRLEVAGLASGATESLTVADLLHRLPFHEQITRLCCVEGWSAVAWWGGVRFADLLAAFPPAPGTKWAAMRAANNLDGRGNVDPYFVSIDLETAHHPQTLLATHFTGRPLNLAHGAPLRLLVPMKLGLKNIKQVTHITYVPDEPPDYWALRGYSRYDGL